MTSTPALLNNQLALNITPRHAYAPENFVAHSGVREILSHYPAVVNKGNFIVGFIVGGPRCGKTHLSIRLTEEFSRRGVFPRLIEGREFAEFLKTVRLEFARDDVFIVDDAQIYLSNLQPGQSGPFVAFVERLRAAGATILFLSERDFSEFNCDEHIQSRLVPGRGLAITEPGDDDMAGLIQAVGKQYGMKLSERKVGFILRRVGKNVAAVEDYFQRLVHLSQVLGRPIKFPLLSGAI